LANQGEQGVPARTPGEAQRLLQLDLKTIRYTAPAFTMKKGVQKPLSIEDKYMMENMQPQCHGMYVTNDYFLCVRCEFNGCTCCSQLPVARIPLTVVPIVNPQVWGYQQPQDFSP
jgi:hypothetical protein